MSRQPAAAATPAGAADAAPGPTLAPRDFTRLSAFIEARYGIRLPPAKKTLLEGRLARRVRALGLPGFGEYCDLVLGPGGGGELLELVDRVTTNKTEFFREERHFELVTERLLPALTAAGAGTRRPLRAWSAACSTGEEPYTLAMVLAEATAGTPGLSFGVLATDLSRRVLRIAREGTYCESQIAPVPLPLRRRYLQRSKADPDVVRIRPGLRARVEFRRLNLLEGDYALGAPQDLVLCRNVLIYFDRALQARILGRIADAIADGGYLLLGHSESITGMELPLDAVAPTVYRRRPRAGGARP